MTLELSQISIIIVSCKKLYHITLVHEKHQHIEDSEIFPFLLLKYAMTIKAFVIAQTRFGCP